MSDRPAWKEDFPVSWVDDHLVTRREFTKSLVWVSSASFAANAVVAARSTLHPNRGVEPGRVRAGFAGDLPVGGSKVFFYPSAADPCLLVRLEEDRFVAFEQKCTHLGCPVLYRPEQRRLHCPCHEGYFDASNGRVLSGPPQIPLRQLKLERSGDELWVTGVVEPA